jgi:dipeptidase E
MRFLLTSAGIKNASIHDALVDLLGKPIPESNALCTPTATHALGGPELAWRFISGLEPRTPMCELGWKSLGVLELTALPSIDEKQWVPMVQETDVLLVNWRRSLVSVLLDAAVRTGGPLAVAARGLCGTERRGAL